MLSTRTILSLCLFLGLQDRDFLALLLEKNGLPTDVHFFSGVEEGLRWRFSQEPADQLTSLLDEIVRTQSDLRARVYDLGRYNERWEDLLRCLALDGYKVEGGRLVPIDPTIRGTAPIDDDLSAELRRSRLPEAEDILRLMESSAEAFRQVPPDYNACLAKARVALETLARAIARARLGNQPAPFDETKWGQVLAYLRTSSLVTQKEEDGLSGVYSFVSPGAHTPVGFTEQEMVRLGRSLVASMCYFLVKTHNAGN